MKISWTTTILAHINILLLTIFCVLIIYLAVLLVKALRKYLHSATSQEKVTEQITEKIIEQKTLGETLKAHRIRCNMTQEFVAERLNVSRQAVSKWENGTSDPSTANLLALANLFDVSAEELLKNIK